MASLDSHCRKSAGLFLVAAAMIVAPWSLRPAPAQDPPAPNPPASTEKNTLDPAQVKKLEDLLNLADKDVGRLAEVSVSATGAESTSSGPTNTLNVNQADTTGVTSAGDLLKQIPNVYGRRLSGINVDPRVRGFNSSQLNANANGMTQYKALQDIDSLLSQIDPGVIQDVEVIEGPYTSLYGPGFAFINVDLVGSKRYERPEIHSAPVYNYASNGQIMYGRENIWGGSKDWGMFCTYGVRTGNDYTAGAADPFRVPSSFEKWDTMLSVSYSLTPIARLEFDFLHTDMNNVEIPGVVYDPENSTNNQFNVRYIIQETPDGPRDLLLQAWHQETFFHGDASSESKQRTFYYPFITTTYVDYSSGDPVNAFANGNNVSTGVRLLRTFGDTGEPLLTVGADWRRNAQRYQEFDVDADGVVVWGGNYYGIPSAVSDDIGALMHLDLPLTDRLSATVGGRVDYDKVNFDAQDPVVTHFDPGAYFFFQPGFNNPAYTLGMAYINGKYKLNDTDTLSAGTGFAMRAPNLSELYFDGPYVPFARFGNSVLEGLSILKPEKNWQCDIGLTCERKPFRYGARGYYATLWDYILPIPAWTDASEYSTHYLHRNFQYFPEDYRDDYGYPSENGDTVACCYQYENISLAMLWGCDLFGELEIRRGLTLFGCVSYNQGRNLGRAQFLDAGSESAVDGEVVRIPGSESLPNIYPLNGWISLKCFDAENDKWQIEFVTRLVNSQNEVAVSLAELPSTAFTVFDLRGYYRCSQNLRLSLSLENLLNTYYAEPGSVVIWSPSGPVFMPEPGFTVNLGLDGKF
jgi:iron complex outermembrane recepter protein